MNPTYPLNSQTLDVWIVEDENQFRETLVDLLNQTPGLHCARAFCDYEEVASFMEQPAAWPKPDVVLMDYKLPGRSGIEGISGLKEKIPEVPIIMLTIHDKEEVIFGAFRAGASGYIVKDTPFQQVEAALWQVQQGGMFMPAAVARHVLSFLQDLRPQDDFGLTPREKEILRSMGEGYSQRKLAEKLFVSPHTINSHLRNIYQKLHVKSGIAAVAKAMREHII